MSEQKNSNLALKLKEGGVVVFYAKENNSNALSGIAMPYGEPLGEHVVSGCGGVLYREKATQMFDAIVCSKCRTHSTMFSCELTTYGEVLRTLRSFKEGRFGIIGQATGMYERFSPPRTAV